MGSETFVDVTWRGLDVGRRVKLRSIRAGAAHLDHGSPMPVGTVLAINTDENFELQATVVRVHEQVGGGTEVPGMEVVPMLLGAAAAWWTARLEPRLVEGPVVVPESISAEPPIAVPLVAAAAPRIADVEAIAVPAQVLTEPSSRTTLSMTQAQITAALDAANRDDGEGPSSPDSADTQVMEVASEESLAATESSEPDGGGEAIDDGARTMVMSVLEVSAIASAAGDADGQAEDADEPSPDRGAVSSSAASASGSLAYGKTKRGSQRRKKR